MDAKFLIGDKAASEEIKYDGNVKLFDSLSEAWRHMRLGDVCDFFWEGTGYSAKEQSFRKRDRRRRLPEGKFFYMDYVGNSVVGAWTAGVFAKDLESAVTDLHRRAGAAKAEETDDDQDTAWGMVKAAATEDLDDDS